MCGPRPHICVYHTMTFCCEVGCQLLQLSSHCIPGSAIKLTDPGGVRWCMCRRGHGCFHCKAAAKNCGRAAGVQAGGAGEVHVYPGSGSRRHTCAACLACLGVHASESLMQHLPPRALPIQLAWARPLQWYRGPEACCTTWNERPFVLWQQHCMQLCSSQNFEGLTASQPAACRAVITAEPQFCESPCTWR
jgi:hypothetical protein